jgi:3-oxoacyl-[acyl-carrier protein] reductase
MFNLDDKVAMVTGGSRGIGRSIALTLADAGAQVFITYQGNEAAAEETVSAIQQAGGRASALRFDVGDETAARDAVDALVKEAGSLHVLVNNAGVAVDQLLLRVKPEEAERTWTTNLNGALWCSKAAIRPMMRAKQGRIINIASVVGEAGNPGQAVYSASKAGLIGLTKTLAREYASRGVTVNAVSPGYIETDMTGRLSEAQRTAIVNQTPLGRVGEPHEVAAAVRYLASDEAAYVTGQVLRVNGGMYV